jgi:hypothetical protein
VDGAAKICTYLETRSRGRRISSHRKEIGMNKTMLCGFVAAWAAVIGCGSDNQGGGAGGASRTGGVGAGGKGGAAGGTGAGGGGGVGGAAGSGGSPVVGWDAGPDAAGPTDAPQEMTSGADTSPGQDANGTWLDPPVVPPGLNLPPGAKVKVHDYASGAQIYACTAGGGGDAGLDGGAATYAWILKAPDAVLFDQTGAEVGTHGAGPRWTSTVDGSVVDGAKIAQADSPDATAIPWLFLRAASTSGTGVFGDITYVQRVNTSKGKAPTSGCDAGAVGAEVRVDYRADYYFYTGGAGADWWVPPTDVPSILAAPAGSSLKLHDHAIGVQVYTCSALGGDGGADAGGTGYAWVLTAPDAILYDVNFAQVGTHGAGPSWISTVDGSVVTGSKLQQSSPTDTAVPWLLLQASSTSGAGVFSDIAYVQRLNTAGGKAPVTACDGTTLGGETRVPYSADYYFFTAASTDGGPSG